MERSHDRHQEQTASSLNDFVTMSDTADGALALLAGEVYRKHVNAVFGGVVPPVRDALEFIAVAAALGNVADLQAAHGWITDPPFPGAISEPARYGSSWMMFCATNVMVGSTAIAQLVTSLSTGKPPAIVVHTPQPLPAGWQPLLSTRAHQEGD